MLINLNFSEEVCYIKVKAAFSSQCEPLWTSLLLRVHLCVCELVNQSLLLWKVVGLGSPPLPRGPQT